MFKLACYTSLHIVALALLVQSSWAQTTAFSYQGKLTEAGNPANGNYDLQFKLFDALAAGTQQGVTLTRTPVAVSAGFFNVTLDFGANVFSGADRYLEIGVRPAGSANPYTLLAPRQAITSSPYAIQTLNAQQLGGVDASQYLKPNDSGYVGIGISNPLSRLHILSNDPDLPPRLESPGINSFASGWDFYHAGTPKGYVGVPGTSASLAPGEMMLFGGAGVKTSLWAGGNRGLTLATNGNVGIGTATPTSKLEIAAQDGLAITGFNPFITLRDTGNNSRKSFIQGVNGDVALIPHSFSSNGVAMVVKDVSGNVGIGTSSPATKLQVVAGNNAGIHATSQSNAILGYSTSPTFAAIYGENLAQNSFGVYGKGGSTGTGVQGDGNLGVVGTNNTFDGVGVYGKSTGFHGIGVYGESENPSLETVAVYGKSNTGWAGYFEGSLYVSNVTNLVRDARALANLTVNGNLNVLGTKNFIEPHPTDPKKMIAYVALEGPEAGTFFRGSGRIINGVATIQVPEEFRMVTDEQGLTVQITPVGAPATIWCVKKSLDNIELKGSADVEFDFLVNGVRRMFKDHTPVVENTAFIPRSTDDDLLKNLRPEAVRRLKANGILKEDGSVNMETVEKLEAFKLQKQQSPLPFKINVRPHQRPNQ